jgi:branched-chain amino acid transport system substrate-binding protein
MLRRAVLKGLAASGLLHGYSRFAKAQDVLKIGICIQMTGAGFNAVGRQLSSAIKLYVEQHGDVVAGRRIEILMRDDGGVADNARRIVQEMIVNDKVALIGIGITPTSLAIAPLITEARIATVVLSSGASITVTKSPYMVRAGFVLAPQSWNGQRKTAANVWLP